jgi:hypothetical protein
MAREALPKREAFPSRDGHGADKRLPTYFRSSIAVEGKAVYRLPRLFNAYSGKLHVLLLRSVCNYHEDGPASLDHLAGNVRSSTSFRGHLG